MKEEFFVYAIYSTNKDQIYKRHTNSLRRRLFEHNAGLERSTKHGAPWKLIYSEAFVSRSDAMKREAELKTGKGRDFLKQFRPGSPPRRRRD